MLNIAILHYSCPTIVGGVEEIVRQQASLFYRHYHRVKILAGRGDQFTVDYPIELNPWLDSQHPEIAKFQADQAKYEFQIREIAEDIFVYLKNSLKHFDILIAHNVLTMPYNLPLTIALHRLANQKAIRVISWNHDSPYFYPDNQGNFTDHAWSILKKYNANIFYITISDTRAKEFQTLYEIDDAISVIPNGIDPNRFFRLDPMSIRLIREEDLFNANLLLVQPSRIHPRKNIELSIHVIKALRDIGIKARLLLTGAHDPHEKNSRDYHIHLKELAASLGVQDDIIVVAEHQFKSGQKISSNRVTMRDLYHIADLLFLPSKIEGFGIPLLEAGMIKLPIACADIPPFKSIAGDDVCYFSLDDEPKEIAQKIITFLKKLPPHRMFRNVIKKYVWDNIYRETLLPFLEKVMAQ